VRAGLYAHSVSSPLRSCGCTPPTLTSHMIGILMRVTAQMLWCVRRQTTSTRLANLVFALTRRAASSSPGPWFFSLPLDQPSSLPALRVEFLLQTDSEYPRDAEVTLFTLSNPGSSLRFNTHWSAPPVSALARSGGPGARQAEGL